MAVLPADPPPPRPRLMPLAQSLFAHAFLRPLVTREYAGFVVIDREQYSPPTPQPLFIILSNYTFHSKRLQVEVSRSCLETRWQYLS